MKKITQLLFTVLILHQSSLLGQTINIKNTYSVNFNARTELYEEYFRSGLAIDKEGNKIIVGGFDGQNVAFDATHAITSDSNTNIFIAKYDSKNVLLWIKNIGGKALRLGWGATGFIANDGAVSVKTDDNNNIYILADVDLSSSDLVDFDPEHPATNSILQTGDDRNKDIVFAKYAPDGTLLWTKIIGDDFSDKALKMILDNQNHIWITGTISGFTGNKVDFDREHSYPNGEDLLDGQVLHLGFIAHYDNDANFISVNGMGPGLFSELNVQVGATGNVYVAGSFNGTDTKLFLEDTHPALISSVGSSEFSSQNQDIFLMKYTASGEILWVKTISSPSYSQVSDLVIDEKENLYLTGWFNGSDVDFDRDNTFAYDVKSSASKGSAFLAKYSTDGTVKWVNTVADGSSSRARTVELFHNYLVFSGNFLGNNVRFGDVELSSNSYSNAFISLLNTDGTWIDTEAFPTSDYSSVTNLKFGADGTLHFLGFNAGLAQDFVDVKGIFFGEIADIVSVTEVAAVPKEAVFSLFPNPSNKVVQVQNNGSEKINSLELHSMSGKSERPEFNPATNSLDIGNCPKGIYLLKITTESGSVKTLKIVKN